MNAKSTDSSPVLLSESPPAGRKTWRAGTITYTKAGLAILFCWLLWGDLAYQLRDRAFPSTLLFQLTDFHATDTQIGLLTVSIPALIVIIISPIISYFSDRHRGRWGRRIPYLFWITPISVAAMVGLAFAPRMAHSNGGVLAYLAIFSIIFGACDTVCNLIFMALCNDVVPREIVGRFFGMFRVVSLSAGIYYNHYLLKISEKHASGIFLSMAAIYGFGFILMCLRVKEGDYPPPEAKAPDPIHATITYLRDCFGISYYRWLFASIALAMVSFAPVNGFVLVFAKSKNMDMSYYGNAAALQLLISLVQAYPLGWLADKIHPLRLTIISMCMFATATLLSFIFIQNINGIATALVIVGVCSGWWLTANGPLCMALFPKVEFSQFYAAMNITTCAGTFVVGWICGKLLDYNHHDYRYIYLWAFVLAILSLAANFVVYRKFLALGGTKAYVAPIST